MAPDEPNGARPPPVVLRIKLRYDDVEMMIARFAPNVGRSGLFLPTKSLQPVGAEVKFELRLIDDKPVLVGLGRVRASRAPDPANARASFGMAVELTRVTKDGRELVLKMLERRASLGLPEVGIPMPADIDAARRRDIETQVGVGAAGPATAPILLQRPADEAVPVPMNAETVTSIGTGAPIPVAVPLIDSAPVLVDPRSRGSERPLAVAKADPSPAWPASPVPPVSALAPEPARKRRAPIQELLDRASGSVSSSPMTPGVDDDVDVASALVRARALAGESLDVELEALRELAAAPIEVSIEAASAELARALGGAPVRRDRSAAHWAPPPVVRDPVPVPVVVREPVPVRDSVREPEPEPEPDSAPVPSAALIPEAPAFEPQSTEILPPIVDHEDAPPPIADEVQPLGDADYEEVEHTNLDVAPLRASLAQLGNVEPAVAHAIEQSIDQHLADAEAEDDDDLGIAAASSAHALPLGSGDLIVPSDDELARLALPPTFAPAEDRDDEDELDDEDIDEIDENEIDENEILAEADASDADLMAARAEPLPPAQLVTDIDSDAERTLLPPDPEDDPDDEFADEYTELPIESAQRAFENPPAIATGRAANDLSAHLGASPDAALSIELEHTVDLSDIDDPDDGGYTLAGDLPDTTFEVATPSPARAVVRPIESLDVSVDLDDVVLQPRRGMTPHAPQRAVTDIPIDFDDDD